MNLVMIGSFKNVNDAEKTRELINQLTEGLKDKIEIGATREKYGEDVIELLKKVDTYLLRPFELEQFLYEVHMRIDGNKIIITTDESEVSAFFKLMVNNGAKVEIYSGHDYKDSEYGRGK
jgi:hypothetical protein